MKTALATTLTTLLAAHLAAAADKPSIRILATGGTIAGAQAGSQSYGYKSGSFRVEDLIGAVPQLKELADLGGEPGNPLDRYLRLGAARPRHQVLGKADQVAEDFR